MKKVFTLAFALFICSAAFAQFTNAKSGSRGGNSGGIDFGEMSYKGFVEAGYAIGFGDNIKDIEDMSNAKIKAGRFDISTSHGVQFGGHFFAGLGTGVKLFSVKVPENGKEKNESYFNIPIFADLRANLFEDNSINPYIGLKIGYAIGIEKKVTIFEYEDYWGDSEEMYFKTKVGGFICTPTIGCRFGINEKMGLNVSMGYDIQKGKWKSGVSYGSESEEGDNEKFTANGLVFKVGIDF